MSAVAERGGRSRRFFKVTAAGLREVKAAYRQTTLLAAGLAMLKDGRDA
jgi:hypothetical protein